MADAETKAALARLEAAHARTEAKIDTIEAAITGGMDGTPGVHTRLDRLEQRHAIISWLGGILGAPLVVKAFTDWWSTHR